MALVLRRQRIRDNTIAILQAAGTDALHRVYPTRLVPWRREQPLPAIGVSTLHEHSVPLGDGAAGPFQLKQSLELVLECVVELPTVAGQTPDERFALDVQTPLDTLCAQVTISLLSNPLWRRTADGIVLLDGLERWETRCEASRTEDSDRRTMAATITATVNYTCVAEPTIEDEFCTAVFDVDVIDPAADPNIKYPGPDGRIEVSFVVPRATDPPLCPPHPELQEDS